MRKPGVMFYFESRPSLKRLNYTEKGKLFEAILDYGEYGILPKMEGKLGVVWDFIQPKMDRDNDRYNRVVSQKAYANYCKSADQKQLPKLAFEEWLREQAEDVPVKAEALRMEPAGAGRNASALSGTQTTNYKPQTTNYKPQTPNPKPSGEPSATPTIFSPPDRNAVLEYCREKGIQLDADSFLDYYTANGWMIGKSPMKDWRAAVRRWNRKEQHNEQDGQQWNVGIQV